MERGGGLWPGSLPLLYELRGDLDRLHEELLMGDLDLLFRKLQVGDLELLCGLRLGFGLMLLEHLCTSLSVDSVKTNQP